jgi:acyl carrier protein|tara:strand:- start:130 stop:372 length:243 start_codon:yes stop_codon:yes gene_type:complete
MTKKAFDEEIILKIAKKIFKKTKKLNLDSNIKNITDWDSMNHIILIMEINKKYKISISLEESVKINSIKNIVKVVKKYKK